MDSIVMDNRLVDVEFHPKLWKFEEDTRFRTNTPSKTYVHHVSTHDPPPSIKPHAHGGMLSYHYGPGGTGKTYTNCNNVFAKPDADGTKRLVGYFNPAYSTITNKLCASSF